MAYCPRQAVWELTLKCNMNCMHCGSKAGKQKDNELTLEQCMDIASQLIDMGLKFITLMGGEVFFKKGWDKIARKFVDNGVYVNIITNGNGLGKEQYEQIKNSKIKQIGVSLDGLEKTHNKIRGNPNAFQEATKTLKNLYDMGYATEAITTISSLNIDDLEEMFDLLANLNVEIWQLQLCSPMGNAKESKNFLLDPKYVPYIIDFVVKKNKQKKVYVIAADNIGYFRENEEKDPRSRFQGCLAGLYAVGIDSVGNVKGCLSLYDDKFIEGNLQNQSLKDIWTKDGAFSYNRNFKMDDLKGKCRGCDKGAICRGGCKQLAYFVTGNMCESLYCSYR